jgi:hypothetical protein
VRCDILWGVVDAGKKYEFGGWIVQEIDIKYSIAGADEFSKEESVHFWEVWIYTGDNVRSAPGGDTFRTKAIPACTGPGTIIFTGKVTFIPAKTEEDSKLMKSLVGL